VTSHVKVIQQDYIL